MSTQETTVQFLSITRIGEKGQLTVPKQFREDLGLGNGSPFAVLRLGDSLLLLPEQKRFEELCDQIREKLASAGVTDREALATLPEARKRVFARRYGKPEARPRPRRAK
jgi:AbrB family looped-hinge helix DNA binding protein